MQSTIRIRNMQNSMFVEDVRGLEHQIHASLCIWWHFLTCFSMEFVKILVAPSNQIWTNHCLVVWPGARSERIELHKQRSWIGYVHFRPIQQKCSLLAVHLSHFLCRVRRVSFSFDRFKFAPHSISTNAVSRGYRLASGIVNCFFRWFALGAQLWYGWKNGVVRQFLLPWNHRR